MAKKSFILVSLSENKAKKLAEVISNNTCRKILDLLAQKEHATETDIARELGIPISTVNYNIKALLEAKLVKSDEYHYSEKGKEVNHYKLANQFVIIAPESEKQSIREKLKSIIPTVTIIGVTAGLIRLFTAANEEPLLLGAPAAEEAVRTMVAEKAAADTAIAAAPMMAETVPTIAQSEPNIALWFLLGAVAGIAVYAVTEFIIKKLRD